MGKDLTKLIKKTIIDKTGKKTSVWVRVDTSEALPKKLYRTIAGNPEYQYILRNSSNPSKVNDIRKIMLGSSRIHLDYLHNLVNKGLYREKELEILKNCIDTVSPTQTVSSIGTFHLPYIYLYNIYKKSKTIKKDILLSLKTLRNNKKNLDFLKLVNQILGTPTSDVSKRVERMGKELGMSQKDILSAIRCGENLKKFPKQEILKAQVITLELPDIELSEVETLTKIKNIQDFKKLLVKLKLYRKTSSEKPVVNNKLEFVSTDSKEVQILKDKFTQDVKNLPEKLRDKVKHWDISSVYSTGNSYEGKLAYHGTTEVEAIIREGIIKPGEEFGRVKHSVYSTPSIADALQYGEGREDGSIYVIEVSLPAETKYSPVYKTSAIDEERIIKIIEFTRKEKNVLKKSVVNGKAIWEKVVPKSVKVSTEEILRYVADGSEVAKMYAQQIQPEILEELGISELTITDRARKLALKYAENSIEGRLPLGGYSSEEGLKFILLCAINDAYKNSKAATLNKLRAVKGDEIFYELTREIL